MARPVKLKAPVTTSNPGAITGTSLEGKSGEVIDKRTRLDVSRDHDARPVPDRLSGMHLRSQAVEDRKPQRSVRRPFGVTDAHDQLRPHPMDRFGHDRRRVKWRLVGREVQKSIPDSARRRVVVAASDRPARQQTLILVISDDQGVERLLSNPADDYEVIRLDGFDLEPERAALAGHVRTQLVLGDHALQPSLEAGLEQP